MYKIEAIDREEIVGKFYKNEMFLIREKDFEEKKLWERKDKGGGDCERNAWQGKIERITKKEERGNNSLKINDTPTDQTLDTLFNTIIIRVKSCGRPIFCWC